MTTPMHMPGRAGTVGFEADLVSAVLGDALASGARVYGISGLQGSGKSTLAAQLAAQATERGLRCALLSIDDTYLPCAERLRLSRRVHPLLATRGPPGTHDIVLALEALDALLGGRHVALPRFDKLADDRLPRAQWPRVEAVDLVLFEGWFLGTPAEPEEALAQPLNALEREEDGDGTWRGFCNTALGRDYPALWRRLDRLLLLQAPSFNVVPEWRLQAERELAASRPGAAAMDRAGIGRFVQHYERTSRQALRTLPGIADAVIAQDATRRPTGAMRRQR
jgi:D-glycerate 3-kinase